MSVYDAVASARSFVDDYLDVTEDSDYDLYHELVSDEELQEITLALHYVPTSEDAIVDGYLNTTTVALRSAAEERCNIIEDEHRTAGNEDGEQQ